MLIGFPLGRSGGAVLDLFSFGCCPTTSARDGICRPSCSRHCSSDVVILSFLSFVPVLDHVALVLFYYLGNVLDCMLSHLNFSCFCPLAFDPAIAHRTQ